MRRHRKGSHTIHDLRVHLIWCTKYRYKVLKGEVGLRIRELLRQTGESNDIQIFKGRVSIDHIHLYVSYLPTLSVSDMMKRLKGRSSKIVQLEFPHLKQVYWGKHFWAIGYGAFSAGNVTDETIQNYLDNHEKDDEDFVVEE